MGSYIDRHYDILQGIETHDCSKYFTYSYDRYMIHVKYDKLGQEFAAFVYKKRYKWKQNERNHFTSQLMQMARIMGELK